MGLEHRQKSAEINGREYKIITFGAEQSWGFVSQVMDMLGNVEDTSIGSMAKNILGHRDGLKLIKALVKEVTCQGKAIDFDNHFAEFRKDLLPVVGFSLAENVIPFFDPDSLIHLTGMIEKAMSSSQEL
jgi:hypothetical protein